MVAQAIRERRSIREGFSGEAVPTPVLEEIVTSGLLAPSSKNAQPWRVHVVVDRQLLNRVAESVQTAKHAADYAPLDPRTGLPREWSSTVAESARVLKEAPVAIFVENIGRFSAGRTAVAEADRSYREDALVGYSLELIGLGAMVQNMWLTANSLGLAGVFMGDVLVAEADIKTALGLNGDLTGVLALGRSSAEAVPKSMASDRVRWHT